MEWEIIETQPASAEENMERDVALLQSLGQRSRPILHLYDWRQPSLTFGYFVKPEKVFNIEEAKERGIDCARRPTGGGVVFHLWDLAFSVLVPAKSALYSRETLHNYRVVNQVVQKVAEAWLGEQIYRQHPNSQNLTADSIHLIGEDAPCSSVECSSFCMARPTKYDVILGSRKIAGAAQRKTKEGFLHQGTIALVKPDLEILRALLPSKTVQAAILESTYPLLRESEALNQSRAQLKEILKQQFAKI